MVYKGIRKTKSGLYNSFFYYDDDEKFECASDCQEIMLAMFWLLYWVREWEKEYPDTEIYFTSKKRAIANKIRAARVKHFYYIKKKESDNEK